MAQLLVRKLDEDLIKKIKKRAAENGVSVEEEHRRILKAALEVVESVSFVDHLLNIPVASEDTDDLFERDRSTRDRATEIDWSSEEPSVPLYTPLVGEPGPSEV